MINLNTKYPTLIYNDFLIDPSIMDKIIENKNNNKKRLNIQLDYRNSIYDPYIKFIVDISSNFLKLNKFNHNKNIYYIDIIRYKLNNEKKPVDSGLAWHCENDNNEILITVLLYLNISNTIINGNLMYKDINNNKNIIYIKSGTTIIMDGNVQHKPQDPCGDGIRDLIIVSFKKI
jgi:hypothetical protein